MRVLASLLACVVTFALGASVARSQDWPQFRGPNGFATSDEKQLPTSWRADKNILWKEKIPGYGWSCPIVSAGKVFVTSAVSDKQAKPTGGFGGPGRGGPGGFGGGKH